jgi:hypothetical protein
MKMLFGFSSFKELMSETENACNEWNILVSCGKNRRASHTGVVNVPMNNISL